MKPVRIACVRYLNTVPMIEGLEKVAGLELIPTVPSQIAPMVADGRADIGLASTIDAGQANPALALLPAGMIGCDGPTLTVRLFSAVPVERISRLHADTDSHTSVALCRILLDRLHGLRPEIVQFDAREHIAVGPGAASGPEWPESLLLIGDKVVNDSPPAVRYPHQLDLGEAWKALTGLPFVYAVWMCRADEAGDPRIRTAAALLDRQLRHNLTRLDWIIEHRAPDHRWPADLARHYLGSLLRFRVGPREREAVGAFFREAARLGLADAPAPPWADAEAAAPAAAGAASTRA